MLSICIAMLQNPDDISRFEEFYNKFYNTIYYIAKDHLKTKESAEDCAQEIMMYFAKNFHNITQDFNDNKFKNYVKIVSKCMAIDMYRKEKKHILNVIDADLSELFSLGEEEFEVCDVILLKEAFNAMPEKNRQVFYLKYICGYSGEEISKALNMSEAMVRKRCMLGMNFIREYVKADE